jgi:hypothetical protein
MTREDELVGRHFTVDGIREFEIVAREESGEYACKSLGMLWSRFTEQEIVEMLEAECALPD